MGKAQFWYSNTSTRELIAQDEHDIGLDYEETQNGM